MSLQTISFIDPALLADWTEQATAVNWRGRPCSADLHIILMGVAATKTQTMGKPMPFNGFIN